MRVFSFTIFVFLCTLFCRSSQAQVKNEKGTSAYKSSLRNLVPEKWYLTSSAVVRVTLKKDRGFKQLSLDSVTLNRQLDTLIRQGFTAVEIFATPHGGNSFNGLDAIDRYHIDPEVGTMDDFRRLVRQAHRKKLAVIAFDNLGYSSIDAPHFLKACKDIRNRKTSKETKWFSWADSITAKPPMQPDSFYLGGSKYEKWVYSPVAGKYYWSKWDGVDKYGKHCSLPQYNWSVEWQQEVKNIVHCWMNTGIDGMVVDAVNWYTNYTWQMGRECITDIVASYGNAFIQPEGAGGFHEDPVPWITDGGWNCVQDYGLGIWWEKKNNILVNAMKDHNPSALEDALQNYHDRVVAESGILYSGADIHFKEAAQFNLYVAFSIATGHLYCKSMRSTELYTVDTALARILNMKKGNAAFGQLSRRQKLNTNDNSQYYAFVQESPGEAERILCVFNFQTIQRQITVDMSGVNATSLTDLINGQQDSYVKQMQFILPAYGYRFFRITDNGRPEQ